MGPLFWKKDVNPSTGVGGFIYKSLTARYRLLFWTEEIRTNAPNPFCVLTRSVQGTKHIIIDVARAQKFQSFCKLIHILFCTLCSSSAVLLTAATKTIKFK